MTVLIIKATLPRSLLPTTVTPRALAHWQDICHWHSHFSMVSSPDHTQTYTAMVTAVRKNTRKHSTLIYAAAGAAAAADDDDDDVNHTNPHHRIIQVMK
jgi:hypothetical protein